MHKIETLCYRGQPPPERRGLLWRCAPILQHGPPLLEAAAGQIRHGGEWHARIIAKVHDRHDHRVRENPQRRKFLLKPLQEFWVADQFPPGHLDDGIGLGGVIPGAVDNAHATRTDPGHDPIPATEHAADPGVEHHFVVELGFVRHTKTSKKPVKSVFNGCLLRWQAPRRARLIRCSLR